MKAQIVVIGSSNVDFIMQVERLPAVGETVTDAVFMQTYGGKGANQAVAAARAGGGVTFVTGLGADIYGKTMRENFQRDGINTDYALIAPRTPSGSALIMFDQNGENYLTVAPGANYALTPEHIETCAEVISKADILILQMEIPIPVIERALEVAAASGTRTLLNYAPVRNREIVITDKISVLIVNETEAEALTGVKIESMEHISIAAEFLQAQGPQIVVITLGAEGAFVLSDDFAELIPAFPVTPVDTTAAGDTFCGAFAVALAEGKTPPEAARFANAASALSVTKMGAQPSIPQRAEIEIQGNRQDI